MGDDRIDTPVRAASERVAVLIFVRAPIIGTVKTRLARNLGAEAALEIYRRMTAHVLATVHELGSAVETRIFFTPARHRTAVEEWLGVELDYHEQSDGDLGARMDAAFATAFEEGFRKVVVVGSDLPGLTSDHLSEAIAALDERDAVIGPASDGGYYLLGLSRPLDLFQRIPWSTPEVITRTLERFAALGVEPVRLGSLNDVDEVEDLPPDYRLEYRSARRSGSAPKK